MFVYQYNTDTKGEDPSVIIIEKRRRDYLNSGLAGRSRVARLVGEMGKSQRSEKVTLVYSCSQVCYILADSRDGIEGRAWKVNVCLH